MDDALDPLRARVERAELDLRLLEAMIRIRMAERALARARLRNEVTLGIQRGPNVAESGLRDNSAP
ncbi:MAG: hypothetical protein K1X35_08810 [Caulobacteraceae bacterium]|nr:hypothetical protein [Caulobacteraceae bacterium]